MVNSGHITNEGLEITGKFFVLQNTPLKWNIDANISFNRNKIGGLESDQFAQKLWSSADEVFIQRNGCPIGAIYGYVEDGFYDNLAEVMASPSADIRAKGSNMIGEIKYRNMDNDPNITSNDRVIIGDTNPDFVYGLTNNFEWKGITLSFFLQGSQGNDIFNGNLMDIKMGNVGNITKVKMVGTNAKDMMIDLGFRKRFSTYELSSVGSGNAGRIRAANLLYVDDLIDGIETALSRERLDKLWQQYYTDYRQRKIGDCAELHIATRWSVHDVIGRLEDAYGSQEDSEFIVCPALDDNDESNFDYPYGVGFTTQFYHEQREIMDQASWKALYMNEPIEREGQLYPPDQLQRYFDLPEGEPDAIIGVCDTKTTGSDYCVMPICFQYGNRFYVEDCLCENYAPNIVEVNLVNKICQWNPHMVRFESNVAGGKLAADIQQAVKDRNCRTRIETKWTQQNKETKILVNAPWVMEHCVFRDDSVLHGDQWREYRNMLQQLTSYSLEGKNKHDDVCDAFAQLAVYIQGMGGNKIQIMRRLF